MTAAYSSTCTARHRRRSFSRQRRRHKIGSASAAKWHVRCCRSTTRRGVLRHTLRCVEKSSDDSAMVSEQWRRRASSLRGEAINISPYPAACSYPRNNALLIISRKHQPASGKKRLFSDWPWQWHGQQREVKIPAGEGAETYFTIRRNTRVAASLSCGGARGPTSADSAQRARMNCYARGHEII